MDERVNWWFAGFAAGLEALPEEDRELLYRACGRNCVSQGTLAFYQSVFRGAGGSLEDFFAALDGRGGLGD